jgi:hypothetical protein
MQQETVNRKMIVVSTSTAKVLQEYLGFRHFTRHAYPLDLEWDLMKELIEHLPEVHAGVLAEINAFIDYLKSSVQNNSTDGTEE